MKEYIRKQLDDQIRKIVTEYGDGNLEAVERRFGAVSSFVLQDEKDFIHGIRDDEKTLKKEMGSLKDDFVKGIEEALEQGKVDDRVAYAFHAYEVLQASEQALMGKYGHGLVESLVTYARSLDTNNKSVATVHKSYDTLHTPTDEIDKVLEKRNK